MDTGTHIDKEKKQNIQLFFLIIIIKSLESKLTNREKNVHSISHVGSHAPRPQKTTRTRHHLGKLL